MTIQPAHAARVQPQVCCHLPVKYKIAFSYVCILSCAGGLHIIDFMAGLLAAKPDEIATLTAKEKCEQL